MIDNGSQTKLDIQRELYFLIGYRHSGCLTIKGGSRSSFRIIEPLLCLKRASIAFVRQHPHAACCLQNFNWLWYNFHWPESWKKESPRSTQYHLASVARKSPYQIIWLATPTSLPKCVFDHGIFSEELCSFTRFKTQWSTPESLPANTRKSVCLVCFSYFVSNTVSLTNGGTQCWQHSVTQKPKLKHNCKLDDFWAGFEIAEGYWIRRGWVAKSLIDVRQGELLWQRPQISRSSLGFQKGRKSSIFGQRFITTWSPASSASFAAISS